ncbi:MAG: VOC family protein [Micrococcales bacterium]|nr:VOC family protein [Micrococcales bacterium]
MDASLRIEIFPADVDVTIGFYAGLGFEVTGRSEGPPRYVSLRLGSVRIGAAEAPRHDPALRAAPIGTEIVIEVDDVRAMRDRAVAAGVTLAEDLTERPWGLTDFRVGDPDGYYLRFTDRRG